MEKLKQYIWPVIVGVLGLGVFLLAGCESELALKEKCSQYLATEKNQVEKQNMAQYGDFSISKSLEGVFYSRKFNTCVSVVKTYNPALPEKKTFTTYTDVLTGKIIPNEGGNDLMSEQKFYNSFNFIE